MTFITHIKVEIEISTDKVDMTDEPIEMKEGESINAFAERVKLEIIARTIKLKM